MMIVTTKYEIQDKLSLEYWDGAEAVLLSLLGGESSPSITLTEEDLIHLQKATRELLSKFPSDP